MKIYSYTIDGGIVYIASIAEIGEEVSGVVYLFESKNNDQENISTEINNFHKNKGDGDYSIEYRW